MPNTAQKPLNGKSKEATTRPALKPANKPKDNFAKEHGFLADEESLKNRQADKSLRTLEYSTPDPKRLKISSFGAAASRCAG
jgi:hypothetical protein